MNSLLRQQYNFIKKYKVWVIIGIVLIIIINLVHTCLTSKNESFTNQITSINSDCSNCRVQPDNNCTNIPTIINNNIVQETSSNQLVFCEWQSKCNIQDISANVNYNCCPESQFYNKYSTTLNELSNNVISQIYNYCTNINNAITDYSYNDIEKCREFLLDISKNKPGLLFRRDEIISESVYNTDIINNETITNKDLLGYINRRYPVLKDWVKREKNNNEYKEYIKLINNIKNNNGDINMLKVLIYNNYIKDYESKYNNGFVQNKKYKWRLLDKFGIAINSDEFILNSNEFFKCNGDISSQDICTNLFSIDSDNIFNDASGVNENGYFGVSDNNIKTVADYKISTDPIDKEMESLPEISNQSNMAPVSVINQYLNHITGFYNKQLNNMLGPHTHSSQDKIRFNNNMLDNVNSGYFTYTNELTDNSYDIIPSITGDNSFNYLGPSPYLDINYSFY